MQLNVPRDAFCILEMAGFTHYFDVDIAVFLEGRKEARCWCFTHI